MGRRRHSEVGHFGDSHTGLTGQELHMFWTQYLLPCGLIVTPDRPRPKSGV